MNDAHDSPSLHSSLLLHLSPSHLYASVLLIRAHAARQFVCNPIRRMDQRERGEEEGGGREEERHSGNICKLDLAGENSRYLIAHRLDSINAGRKVKQVVFVSVRVCVCLLGSAFVCVCVLIKEVHHGTVPLHTLCDRR